MRKRLFRWIAALLRVHRAAAANDRLDDKMKDMHLSSALTPQERERIRVSGLGGTRGRMQCFAFYKAFTGRFDSRFIPNDVYASIEGAMNELRYSPFVQHKCNLRYFVDPEHRPPTLLYRQGGEWYDAADREIDSVRAVETLAEQTEFVVKIACGSGGGKGVAKVTLTDVPDRRAYLTELLAGYGSDLIVQQVVRQHPSLARFSEGSVNTIRLLSLRLNGKCTVLSSFLRMGASGSFVDNLANGGVLVGIRDDGTLREWGITKAYRKVDRSPSGVLFRGEAIEEFARIRSFAEEGHGAFPHCRLIGWDITLDERRRPVVIEINLDSAEIEAHQIFNGPVFGERTGEVIDYVRRHPAETVLRLGRNRSI